MGDKIIHLIVSIIAFGVLSSCTASIVDDYRDSYSVFDANKAKGIIVSKRAEKGLYSSPAYFAEVLMYEGKSNAEVTTNEARVTNRQMKKIDLGEEISGYTVNGRQFHTFLDMLHDGFFYLLFTVLGIFFMVGIILWWLCHIKSLRTFISMLIDKFFELPIFKHEAISFSKLIIISLGLAYLVFASSYTLNLYHKVKPFGKVATEAEITDQSVDYRISHDYLDDSRYYLTLAYFDENKEYIEVTKEVSLRTFNKYKYDDPISVSYLKQNPYQVFIQRLSFLEIISSATTIRSIFYGFPILIIVFILYLEWRKRRKNKMKANGSVL
ncbi:hypothetical protein [Siminovitchia fortis]|uniref:hypothetical protein n=1 Tax=Siminovitchia fortis TaxID=254758 RepID=UPI00119D578D|nr:hypothetical protein [Siminovitchia fortis]